MNNLVLIPSGLMFILLASLTFRRVNTVVEQHGTLALIQPRGRVAVMGIFLTLSYILLVPPVYLFGESILPIDNGTDLISKYFALFAVALLGSHLATVYKAPLALRLSTGTPSVVAFTLGAVGLFLTLIASDIPQPSPTLVDYAHQPTVQLHTWFVLLYVAYFVGPLIVPLYRDWRTNRLRLHRFGSGLICVGFALSTGRAITYWLEVRLGPEHEDLFMLISFVSTAFVVIGLAVFAYTRRTKKLRDELLVNLSMENRSET